MHEGRKYMAQWFVAAKKADFNAIAEKFHISPVLARIIRNRDIIEEDEIERFLHADKEQMYSPSLFTDMEKAVSILFEKITEGEKLRIIGDYDVDGICSTHILMRGLTLLGADVDMVIPHRMKDGYGLNESLIISAYEEGIDTIVTCDNGIAAAAEIELAVSYGMTVVITDHHEVPYEEAEDGTKQYRMPNAAAIVNPKREDCTYPFCGICGAVVAYKLIQAMFMDVRANKDAVNVRSVVMDEMLQFAAFATICDVMELRDENRIIVKYGLEAMKRTDNIGLKALIDVNGIEPSKLAPYHIGFILGPCLNATGRLDTAIRATALFQTKDMAEAVRIATELKELNDSRKAMTAEGVERAIAKITAENLIEKKVLIIYLADCHESLAGIIAGRIREKYNKPTFILTDGEDCVKGSGRSIETYHMYEQMSKCKDLFIKYGGHKMAAGLSIAKENIEILDNTLNEMCTLTEDDFIPKVHIDVAMPMSYVTKEFIQELDLLEPFGVGNPKPVFAQKNITFLRGTLMGKNKNVGKYAVCDENGTRFEMVYFGDLEKFHAYIAEKYQPEAVDRLYHGQAEKIALSVIYYPSLNEFRGNVTIQYIMQDFQ